MLKLALLEDFFPKFTSQITILSITSELIRLDGGYSDHLRMQLALHRLLQTDPDSPQQKDACPYLDTFRLHKCFHSKSHNGEVSRLHLF